MPDLEIMADRDVRGARLTELRGLLSTCFPEFLAERTYYKHVPHIRLLALTEGRSSRARRIRDT